MANKSYSLTESVILNGRLIIAGSRVSLTDEEAANLTSSIEGGQAEAEEEAKPKQETKSEPKQEEVESAASDYDDMTKAELKALTDELGIEVNPTGSKGSFVKADYIKALNA